MARTQVVFVGGRAGVGKTSAALALHESLCIRDIRHALIEGDNLDQAWPRPSQTFPDAHLAQRNLSVMWARYRELGYQRLIYTNTASVVTIDELTTAMGDQPQVWAVLLRATDVTAASRLALRERGQSLRRHLVRSAEAAADLDAHSADTVHRLDTDGLSPDDIAGRILRLTGWDRLAGLGP